MDDLTAANRFVEGRRLAIGFDEYPGNLPADLEAAYAVQRAAVELWGKPIQGWKVGRISGDDEHHLGENRFIGPIMAGSVIHASNEPWSFPVIAGGFAAVEAELIAVLGDVTTARTPVFTAENCASFISAWHVGIEIAGSPFSKIMEMGPLASIAGFGNNMGLYVGPRVDLPSPDDMLCNVSIGDEQRGPMRAGQLPGGPLAATAFALNKLRALNQAINPGLMISTGAITGVHPVVAGQTCTAKFQPGGEISFSTSRAAAA